MWYPHLVHRVGIKGNCIFVDDGMNTDRYGQPSVVSCYDKDLEFLWERNFENDPTKLPTHEMIMDVSKGGFFDNIGTKSALLAPMWRESPMVDGEPYDIWYDREVNNPEWSAEATPFDIPKIMKWHVGKRRYEVREELLEALMADDTRELLGL